MSYLKKIVGFFVVSVFSIYNCSASSSSSLELKPDSNATPNSLQVVSCQPPSGIPTDREARKVLFSPPYEQLSLPPTLPSAECASTLTVRIPKPKIGTLEIHSPVTILLSPPGGRAILHDVADLTPTEAIEPPLAAASNGALILGDADDSESTPTVEIASLFTSSQDGEERQGTLPKAGNSRLLKLPSAAVNCSSPKATRRARRSSTSSAELVCQAMQLHGTSSMPSSPLLSAQAHLDTFLLTDTKVILSIDGGGSRGIIPLQYLVDLQNAIQRPLKFDMIAGTSVGALVGASVALNRVQEMHGNFQDSANRIFTKSWWSFWGLWRPAYISDGRSACIEELVHDMNGRDLGTNIIVPFWLLLSREPYVYKNFGDGEEFKLSDILMMTSAAPTYFNPHNCISVRGTAYEGIDGGVFANHPGVIAYHEAKQLYPNSKILMLSLGTGAHNSCSNKDQSRNRGLIYWGQTFSDISIEASSFLNNKLLIELARTDPNFEYIRLQPFLEQSYMVTDGINPEHIRKLATIAHKSIGVGGSERERFQQAVGVLSRLQ